MQDNSEEKIIQVYKNDLNLAHKACQAHAHPKSYDRNSTPEIS